MFIQKKFCFSILPVIVLVIVLSLTFEITKEKYPAYSTGILNSSATSNNMTSSLHSADFNFTAVGDWGCTSNTNMTVNNVLDKKPELVLALGDYSYNRTSDDCWFKIVNPINEKMKIAIGNHDHRGIGQLNRYMNHFGLKEQYYSFDYQNIHFIALSTEIPYNATSAQYKFVKSDLSNATSNQNIDWIVVYYHRPMYTLPSTHAAISALRSTYHPLFEQYGVDLVLQGHNHNYQRTYPIKFTSTDPSHPIETTTNTTSYTYPDGQIFVTVGTGGIDLYPFTDPKGSEKYYYIKQYLGFGILSVDTTNNGRTLTGKFYANDGNIIDQFTIVK
jgi:predicted MPP superfamily phosphohydrolase